MDLHELVGERLRLLEFLRTAQAGDDRVDDVLDEYGNRLDSRQAAFLPEERKLEEAKITAAGVVAASERGIKQLVYICELVRRSPSATLSSPSLRRSDPPPTTSTPRPSSSRQWR